MRFGIVKNYFGITSEVNQAVASIKYLVHLNLVGPELFENPDKAP